MRGDSDPPRNFPTARAALWGTRQGMWPICGAALISVFPWCEFGLIRHRDVLPGPRRP